jgi:hypothetical protein
MILKYDGNRGRAMVIVLLAGAAVWKDEVS